MNFKLNKLSSITGLILLGGFLIFVASCDKKNDDNPEPEPNEKTEVLPCDYFEQDRVLKNDTNVAVDYIIGCVMSVEGHIEVEPGVVIEFKQDAGIKLRTDHASFSAIGTEDEPIVFRGVDKSAGSWKGLFFDNGSDKNELSYVHIENAGGDSFNSNGDKGGVVVYSDASLKVTHCLFQHNKNYGLNCQYIPKKLVLQNNEFTKNDRPLVVTFATIGSVESSNDISDNTENFVYVYTRASKGDLGDDATWHHLNAPYKMMGSVNANAVLTIEPGVKVYVPQEFLLKISRDDGGLIAVGTKTDSIVFTSETEAPKAWKGIYIMSKYAANEIAYCEFHYSGLLTGKYSDAGNIFLKIDAALNIHDTKFYNINGAAIYYDLYSGTTENPNLTIGSNIEVLPSGTISAEW